MNTLFLDFNEDNIRIAGDLIASGQLVAFPTETVYGLGADARNAQAVHSVFDAKGRPADNPLIVHIAASAQIYEIASRVPEIALRLAGAFWPGRRTGYRRHPHALPSGRQGVDRSLRVPDRCTLCKSFRTTFSDHRGACDGGYGRADRCRA